MKLKFKADAQDVLIFVIFAIFLLYIVCLGVLNFPSLALEGHFYGLNPLPAFAPDKLLTTIVLYLLFLAGIFMSVSSYFFDRESGVGFSIGGKSDKGYSRWAKDKEMIAQDKVAFINQTDENSDAGGVPLLMKNDKILVDNGEYHNLVIGATGSGKTQTIIFPTVEILAKHKESMIITDPKGEIYENTSNMLREKGYDVLVLNFRDPQDGNCWNPMTLPYKMYKEGNQDKAIELLDDLAANILYEEKSGNADPFWEKTSADYFAGLSLGLFDDADESEVNLNSISTMTTVGEDKFGGSTYMKEYFNMKDPSGAAYTNASGTIMAPNETKGSIISVFKQKIKLFATRDNLSEMLSHSDVNLDTIGEKPTALYIVIQDEKKTYHSLVTILLKQCYEELIATAQRHGGKLPVRTNFLLDEFANMPPLKDITTMITAARSRAIRFTMIIQNFAQLDQVYGKENAETIRGNCGNLIYLITTELKALEEISKMCGEVKSKKDDKTASTPLVTVSDLQKMKQFEVIIMRLRLNPFKTKFIPYYKWDIKRYSKAEYPHREKEDVHVFDLREFVKAKKKEKMMEMMANGEGLPGGVPGGMMGSMPPSMFGGMQAQPRPMPQGMPIGAPDGGLNVDDLIKKIDAKIAEIEAEEKREAEKSRTKVDNKPEEKPTEIKSEVLPETKPVNIVPTKEDINEVVKEEIKPVYNEVKSKPSMEELLRPVSPVKEEINEVKQEISKNSEDKDSVIIHEDKVPENNEISDDQFFDDFFDD